MDSLFYIYMLAKSSLPRKDGALDFDAMDSFMSHIIDVVSSNGEVAVRVFPPDSFVLQSFADKVAIEIVGRALITVLSISNLKDVTDQRVYHPSFDKSSGCVERGVSEVNRCDISRIMAPRRRAFSFGSSCHAE